MKTQLIQVAFLAGIALSAPSLALAGGSDGGTNTDKVTKEPVEFQEVGLRVRIDPRTFEGIYAELLPRIREIEKKIPGLGKDLEMVLDQRSWFITDQEFPARNNNEEQPINQDDDHVFLTANKIKEMSREQLKKAWLHEMVRRLVHDGNPKTTPDSGVTPGNQREYKRLTELKIDDLVGKLSVVLYYEYDMPAGKLVKLVNEALGDTLFEGPGFLDGTRRGYLSRAQINSRIRSFQLGKKLATVCNAENMLPEEETGPLNSADCFSRVGNVKTADSARAFVKECVKPGAAKNILAALNELRDKHVETEDHYSTEPFRTYTRSTVWNDGYDSYAHAPMNNYGSLGSLFGIGFFETGISAAISGKLQAGSNIPAQTFDDSGRVVGAVVSCLFVTGNPEAVLAIKAAEEGESQPESAGRQAVTTMAEALAALESPGARQAQQNSAASDAAFKDGSEPSYCPVTPSSRSVASVSAAK